MGRQYNKIQKRKRREARNERKNIIAKSKIKTKKA